MVYKAKGIEFGCVWLTTPLCPPYEVALPLTTTTFVCLLLTSCHPTKSILSITFHFSSLVGVVLLSSKYGFTTSKFVALIDESLPSSVVAASPVRNGLFASRACPLRGSCFPEFAIELVPVAFSVLLAFLPTVAFPSVVSSLGLSTCALGLLRKPLFTVIKSLL